MYKVVFVQSTRAKYLRDRPGKTSRSLLAGNICFEHSQGKLHQQLINHSFNTGAKIRLFLYDKCMYQVDRPRESKRLSSITIFFEKQSMFDLY